MLGEAKKKAKYGDELINEIKTKSFDRLSYDNKNYYVDLLLFNYKLIRYIMCELKLGEIKPGDVAQTKVYMLLTGKFLKRRYHNETKGIIITLKNGKLALEYVSDLNIFVTTYKLNSKIKMVNT